MKWNELKGNGMKLKEINYVQCLVKYIMPYISLNYVKEICIYLIIYWKKYKIWNLATHVMTHQRILLIYLHVCQSHSIYFLINVSFTGLLKRNFKLCIASNCILYLYLFIFRIKTTKQGKYTKHALIQNNEIRLDSPTQLCLHDTAVLPRGPVY